MPNAVLLAHTGHLTQVINQRFHRKRRKLRVLLNKRSRTNLATDYAWGKGGARGFYLGIQEAF